MIPKNRSEQLFKPKLQMPETASLIKRDPELLDADLHWYRYLVPVLRRWPSSAIVELKAILARIALADKNRTYPQLLDTVSNYQPGNWVYELMSVAADCYHQAETTTGEQALSAYLAASRFAALAGYPHYKTDPLANQAQLYAYRAYRQALDCSPWQYQQLQFTVGQAQLEAILHLPAAAQQQAVPVLVLCPDLTDLQIDFYDYFAHYLAPHGIALLTLDLPGVALSQSLKLQQASSEWCQAVVAQLAEMPWIHAEQIMLAGIGFGCQIALRTAYLSPLQIKAVLCLQPMLHQLFVDSNLQQQLPLMYQDLFASRLGLEQFSMSSLATELRCFSLKQQGLLTHACPAAVMSIATDNLWQSEQDAKLIRSSKPQQIIKLKNSAKKELASALQQASQWLLKQI